MRNKYGEILYRSDNGEPRQFKFLTSIFCRHKQTERAQFSTGMGVFADVFEAKICKRCGKIINKVQVW